MILKRGSIVDSTIISASSSIKNKERKRDPDAHQTKKGNNWYFGYKAHIGVDKISGLVHHVEVTAANVRDVTMVSGLLYGWLTKESRVITCPVLKREAVTCFHAPEILSSHYLLKARKLTIL